MSFLKVFFFFCSVAILFSGAEQLSNFDRGSPKEHFCEIILKSGYWPGRRCHLKVFLFLALVAIFVQCGGTILAILVEGHPRKISMELF